MPLFCFDSLPLADSFIYPPLLLHSPASSSFSTIPLFCNSDFYILHYYFILLCLFTNIVIPPPFIRFGTPAARFLFFAQPATVEKKTSEKQRDAGDTCYINVPCRTEERHTSKLGGGSQTERKRRKSQIIQGGLGHYC